MSINITHARHRPASPSRCPRARRANRTCPPTRHHNTSPSKHRKTSKANHPSNIQPHTCSRDPIGYRGGLHLSLFLLGRSLINVDPTGLFQQPAEVGGPMVVQAGPPVPAGHGSNTVSEQDSELPCANSNTRPTEARICRRRIRQAGRAGGHVFLRVKCGPTLIEKFAFSGNRADSIPACKDKCRSKQLRGNVAMFVPPLVRINDDRGREIPVSTEYAQDGDDTNCVVLTVDKTPKEFIKCTVGVGDAVTHCCIPYQAIPAMQIVPGSNSNSWAIWLASKCFSAVTAGGPGRLPETPNVPTPGWGQNLPECIKKAIR